ncbi:MAG: methyltransferase domain-containing protein [Chloroflexota bacterium]|nr:methyltransferase domain-containing protein [Chloroflexota bacterium]
MAEPTLSQQVTKLYDLIAGYHATHLLEIGRVLGVWEAITARPGITSNDLARQLGTDPFYTDVLVRTAFAFELVDHDGAGWRMAAHFDQILGTPSSTFYLGTAPGAHFAVGADYADYVRRFREGARVTYQEHGPEFMRAVAEALKALPRIFTDLVLPKLPQLQARFESGARVLDVGCGAGAALVHLAEHFPNVTAVGVDNEPQSIELANALIEERGLKGRCEARLMGAERLAEDGAYDVATSFLVVHEIDPKDKTTAFAAIARALKPGGSFVIFDETYPATDAELRTMPARFAALAQWFELTWGNRVNTRAELVELCRGAGLQIGEETTFSRFYIGVAEKR